MKRTTLIIVASFTALLMAGWWYVFHTDAGVHFLLARLSGLRSLQIVAEDVQGHLAGRLTIKHIVIDHKLVHVEADDIVLELSPAGLWAQTIRVNSVAAARARVDVKKIADTEATISRFFPGFLQLVANDVDVRDARVTVYDNFVQTANRVRGRLRLGAQRLQVDDIQIDAPPYSTTAGSLTVLARRPIELQVNTRLTMPAPLGPALDTKIAIAGPVTKLHVDGELLAPSPVHLRGDFLRNTNWWQFLGEATSTEFSFAPWLQKPPFALRDVAVKIDAGPDDIHVAGTGLVPEVDSAPLQFDLHGQYASRVIAITHGEIRPAKSDMAIVTAARIDITERHPVLAATAQWSNFRWPIRENYFVSPHGQLSLSGALPFAIGVNAEIVAQNIGAQLSAHGTLSDAAIDCDEMLLAVLSGEVKGAARLNFSPAREWRAAVSGKNIDPQALNKGLPGKVAFKVDASGAGLDRNADFAITLPELKGVLRGEPLNGHGFLSHDAGGWTAKEFSADLGAAHLAASGEWRQRIDLAWSLELPALEKFLTNAGGTIRFQGTAHGTPKSPQLAGSLFASRLRYGAWNAGAVSLVGNFDLSDQLVSQLDLDTKQIGWKDIRCDALRVHSQGKASAHVVEIRATTDNNDAFSRVTTRIEGTYRNGDWQARVAPLTLINKDGIAPTAEATQARLAWSSQESAIDDLCVLWMTHRLCVNGTRSEHNGWHLDAESDSMPLSLFDNTFPSKSRYLGSWQIHARLAGTGEMPWTGQARVDVTNASLAIQPIAGAEELVRLGTGRVDLTATNDQLVATARIVTPGTTNIDAGVRIERTSSLDLAQAPLNGEIHASTADANLLPLFFPDLDRSAGELTAQLRVGGTASAPLVQGQIDLQKGEIDLYRYNLSVRDLGVAARIADNRLTFDGQANIGQGKLAMNGALAWQDRQPAGTLHLQGENLLVANLPEYRVAAAPNVDFKIDGKRIDASGEVVIPTAHIQPHDLRGAVQTSRDVRFVGELPEAPLGGYDVRSEVRVRLGDDVQLDTYGLQGKLGGSVLISTNTLSSIGRGELNVADGHYAAYGQKLDIARGRLLFDASPLNDPGLDIQAARKIEDTRVGVNVRGTLRAPRVTLFSEPGLPQSQIVSMLLTGKPLADLSSRDAATIGAAQGDLRVQGGSVLAAQIGRRIGLEEVSVESTGLKDTSLVLGKFLSPRLFVSYGISLTESINTLKLRYTISDRWLIRTEAGVNQSADVEYRIER